MAITFETPKVDAKNMWKRLRAGLWTVICALAVCAFLLPNFEPIAFLTAFRNWLILLALVVFFWPIFAKRFGV